MICSGEHNWFPSHIWNTVLQNQGHVFYSSTEFYRFPKQTLYMRFDGGSHYVLLLFFLHLSLVGYSVPFPFLECSYFFNPFGLYEMRISGRSSSKLKNKGIKELNLTKMELTVYIFKA